MITKLIIEIILYGLSVLLPSIISIITISKKTYFNKLMNEVKHKLDLFIDYNLKSHVTLTDRLDTTNNIMMLHTSNLHNLLRLKTVASRVRLIVKHAIDYCGNRNVGKIMDYASLQLIQFGKDILDIGILNITKLQLLAKFWSARHRSSNFGSSIMLPLMWALWLLISNKIYKKFINYIFLIKDDPINSKLQRFIIKLEDMAQYTIRLFIGFVSKQSYTLSNLENLYDETDIL